MQCVRCLNGDTQVVESRIKRNIVKRRRQCVACQYRFTSFEVVIPGAPGVIAVEKMLLKHLKRKAMPSILKQIRAAHYAGAAPVPFEVSHEEDRHAHSGTN